MQTVTRYLAYDGSEWQTEALCKARESMIDEVAAAMSVLKPTPTECNWSGYVQQSGGAVLVCKSLLFRIADREGVLKWAIDTQRASHGRTDAELIKKVHPSWFERMLDGDHRPLGVAYGRLCCIDSTNREWNQPYYAENPGTGDQVCVG